MSCVLQVPDSDAAFSNKVFCKFAGSVKYMALWRIYTDKRMKGDFVGREKQTTTV